MTYAMHNPYPSGKFSLGKEEKLRKPAEFIRVFRNGKSQSTEHFQIFIFPAHTNKQRLGITARKKIGGAVKRNRIKRLLREFFRLHKIYLPPSSDILFVAKPGADLLDYSGLREELAVLFSSKSP